MIQMTQSKDFNCHFSYSSFAEEYVPHLGLALHGWGESVALQLPVSEGSASTGPMAGKDLQLENLQDTYIDLKKSATCLYGILVLRSLILGTLYSSACP